MESLFTVTDHRSKSGCCDVIGLAGELDLATAPHLEAVLDRMVTIPDHIIVDVSALGFVDSTGLRLLLRASKLVERRIWLKGANRNMFRLLEVSGTTGCFCLQQDPVLAHRTIAQQSAGQQQALAPAIA